LYYSPLLFLAQFFYTLGTDSHSFAVN